MAEKGELRYHPYQNMPAMNQLCLFHMERPEFERMERDIRRAKLIPREYCHRLASAVCACRKHKEWHPDEAKLVEHAQYLDNMLQTNNNKLSNFLVSYLKKVLEAVKFNPSDYSRCRLLQILFLAHYDNYVLLTRSAIKENAVFSFDTEVLKDYQEFRQKEKMKDGALKLTKNMFKTSNPGIRHISASDDGHCSQSSFADAHKCHDSHSKKENVICTLNGFTTKRNFDNNMKRAYADVRMNNPGSVRSLRSVLKQQRREKCLRFCESPSIKKPSIKPSQDDYLDIELADTSLDHKGRLTADFEVKRHESRVMSRKLTKKSVLDGGHCRQCLQPFTSLSHSGVCKHHPGFVSFKPRYRRLTKWDDFFEQKLADYVKMFGLPVPNEGSCVLASSSSSEGDCELITCPIGSNAKSMLFDSLLCMPVVYPSGSMPPMRFDGIFRFWQNVGGSWTCCDKYVGWKNNMEDLKTSHAQDGCKEGVHSWTLNRRLARKPNRYMLERNPTLMAHLKEHRRIR